MKTLVAVPLFLVACLLVAAQGDAQDAKDKNEKGKVGALPPHPLDGAFEKGKTARDLTEGLLNDKLFQKAVKNALAAKQEAEAMRKKFPNIAAPSPAQAARQAFLNTLRDGDKAGTAAPADKKDAK